LDDAASSSGNTVRLGAATYPNGPFTLSSSNQVAIVGHGQGQTVLTAPGGTSVTVLTLGDPSATLTRGRNRRTTRRHIVPAKRRPQPRGHRRADRGPGFERDDVDRGQ